MAIVDLVAACDAVVTKPGYGIVADLLVDRVPALYVSRDGFREEPVLTRALEDEGRAVPLAREALDGSISARRWSGCWPSTSPGPNAPSTVRGSPPAHTRTSPASIDSTRRTVYTQFCVVCSAMCTSALWPHVVQGGGVAPELADLGRFSSRPC